jgi:2-polyprenyl-3-methyl-5-hydroxy-6-metoxy-1,4-benzoquinol methylase
MPRYLKRFKIWIKSVFAPEGVVGPHTSSSEWDEQFSKHKWDYLANESQREHYDCILEFYKKYADAGNMLDIGCGIGLLCRYAIDTKTLDMHRYMGIDISRVAIDEAIKKHPGAAFRVLNYEHEQIQQKYNAVIFNETLYYFDHAGKTLQKCCKENLLPGGVIIISMCDHERHDLIWKLIDANYKVLDTRKSVNEEGISWTIKVLQS